MPQHQLGGGPLTIDSAGRIVATSTGAALPGALVLYRYLPNGQLDPQFGLHGITTLASVNGAAIVGFSVTTLTTDIANRVLFGIALRSASSAPSAVVRLSSY
jgi:hypothetical protein